jgi:hypothetical protein
MQGSLSYPSGQGNERVIPVHWTTGSRERPGEGWSNSQSSSPLGIPSNVVSMELGAR